MVAVLSGRPAGFLGEHLGHPTGVRLVGLYGLEEVGSVAGPTVEAAEVERWAPLMAALAARAAREVPQGVSIEEKGLGFTLHYREAPERGPWVEAYAAQTADRDGVVVQRGRMAVELRPGIDVDKGSVARALAGRCQAACCFGDDLGDLATFKAMDDLARQGRHVARVAVRDEATPRSLLASADLVVEGPAGALEVLRALARA